jgi:hypothetical protein
MSLLNLTTILSKPAASESIYRHCIPDFVAEPLDCLYGNLHSSLAALNFTNPFGTSTYVKWTTEGHSKHPESIFLFQKIGQSLRVLNEGMRLKKNEVDHFCEYVFSNDEKINRIDFHAVVPPEQHLSRPNLRWVCTEDIVITLPSDEQHYLNQLGKATRKSIKKHLSRAQQELPDFHHSIHAGNEVSEEELLKIVGFNHSRMAGKQKLSALNTQTTKQLLAIIRSHGIVGLVSSDKGLGAGTLACRFGDDVFSLITAHDPAYDSLGFGTLSRHLMIIHSIRRGAKRFHLLGGNMSSKRSALGVREKLDHLTVYRSTIDMLREPTSTLQLATNATKYHIHRWLEDQSANPENSGMTRIIHALRHSIRAWRRWISLSKTPALTRGSQP